MKTPQMTWYHELPMVENDPMKSVTMKVIVMPVMMMIDSWEGTRTRRTRSCRGRWTWMRMTTVMQTHWQERVRKGPHLGLHQSTPGHMSLSLLFQCFLSAQSSFNPFTALWTLPVRTLWRLPVRHHIIVKMLLMKCLSFSGGNSHSFVYNLEKQLPMTTN